MGFVLDQKSDLCMRLEIEHSAGTYANGDVASIDPDDDLVAWRTFTADKLPINEPSEEGVIGRRMGQPLTNLGYTTKWSGSIDLEEVSLIATDVATPKLRPNVHMLLRASGFAEPTYAWDGSTATLHYDDETFPEKLDSIEAHLYEYLSDESRNLFQLTGAVAGLQVTMEPQKPILFEAIDGGGYSLSDATPTALVPSKTYTRTARVPFNGATIVLQTLGGGSTYASTAHVHKAVLRTKSNTFTALDGRSASGVGRVYNNPFQHAELDLLVQERSSSGDLSMRQAWADNSVLHFTCSVPGPAVAANVFSTALYGGISSVEPQRGPGGERLSLVKCKLLWSGGAGAVGNSNRLTWQSTP